MRFYFLKCGSELLIVFAEKPDPPTDLELTDQTERSVQLTWIPGDEHNSPTQSMKCTCLLLSFAPVSKKKKKTPALVCCQTQI